MDEDRKDTGIITWLPITSNKQPATNYLEVITAQGNALQAELDLAAIRREQLGAMVELYRSLGGGWK